jgi:hypothetical protein
MSKPKVRDIPHIEVADPAAAYHKLEEFTRRIMAVPKKEIDRRLAQEKRSKRK